MVKKIAPPMAVLVGLVAMLLPLGPAAAQSGNVLISPKRVVFAERARSAEVNLVNHGERSITYRIEWVERRMTPEGSLEVLDEPGVDSARHLVRFAPRQITVEPGATQKIRLALRKPADLEPREYRSHLLARALPPEDDGADIETVEEANGLSVTLNAIPSIAIPVIVRHGELEAGTALSELDLLPHSADDPSRQLAFRLHRHGHTSIYGDLVATLVAENGEERVVGLAKGLGVYPPLEHVDRRIVLQLPEGAELEGRIRLSFATRPGDDGGGEPLEAEAELRVP